MKPLINSFVNEIFVTYLLLPKWGITETTPLWELHCNRYSIVIGTAVLHKNYSIGAQCSNRSFAQIGTKDLMHCPPHYPTGSPPPVPLNPKPMLLTCETSKP
jgi:hypothetical protein